MPIRPKLKREPKALFIHIPKNAGQAVKAALNRSTPVHLYDANGKPIHHVTYQQAIEINPKWAQLPSLAVLRHPYERFVSAYYYLRGNQPDPKPRIPNPSWVTGIRGMIEVVRQKFLTFESFIEAFANGDYSQLGSPYLPTHENQWFHPWTFDPFMCSVFFRPQQHYIGAVENICRIETLQEDIDRFCADYGFDRVTVKRRNGDQSPGSEAVLGDAEKKIIQKHYAVDFEVLGFDP